MKKIAIFSSILLLLISINATGQNFLKHYTFRYNSASLNESPIRFAAITTRDDNDNLLIAGSAYDIDNPSKHALVILELDQDGNLVPGITRHVIEINGAGEEVHPMGILFETYAHANNAVVVGYLTKDNDSSAFIIRYNLGNGTPGTAALVWTKIITNPTPSVFFDIDYYNSSSWLVCGHFNANSDAMIYTVNKSSGALTTVYQGHGALPPGANNFDSYFALNYNASNQLLAGASRIGTAVGYENLRPGLTMYNFATATANSDYYITPSVSSDARLYSADVARRGNNQYSIIINGDKNGDGGGANNPEQIYQDMFVVRTDNTGALTWGRKLAITLTNDDCEGVLQSIDMVQQTFPPTAYLVVYGAAYDNVPGGETLGNTMIMVLNGNATAKVWNMIYPGLTPYSNICPNAMITNEENGTIFGVGYSTEAGIDVGGLVRTTFTDGYIADFADPDYLECNQTFQLSITNETFDATLNMTTINDALTVLSPEDLLILPGFEVELICENELKTSAPTSSLQSLIISAIDANMVDFYLTGEESDVIYTLDVFNIVGQLITSDNITVNNSVKNSYTSGVYIYQLRKGNQVIDNAKFVVK